MVAEQDRDASAEKTAEKSSEKGAESSPMKADEVMKAQSDRADIYKSDMKERKEQYQAGLSRGTSSEKVLDRLSIVDEGVSLTRKPGRAADANRAEAQEPQPTQDARSGAGQGSEKMGIVVEDKSASGAGQGSEKMGIVVEDKSASGARQGSEKMGIVVEDKSASGAGQGSEKMGIAVEDKSASGARQGSETMGIAVEDKSALEASLEQPPAPTDGTLVAHSHMLPAEGDPVLEPKVLPMEEGIFAQPQLLPSINRNERGDPTEITDSQGHTTIIEYGQDNQPTKIVDGATGTTFTKDDQGQWIATFPDGRKQPLDAVGVGPDGDITLVTENGSTTIKHPDSSSEFYNAADGTTIKRNPDGDPIAITNPEGQTTTIEYGQDGQPVRVTDGATGVSFTNQDGKWAAEGLDPNAAVPKDIRVDANGDITFTMPDGKITVLHPDGAFESGAEAKPEAPPESKIESSRVTRDDDDRPAKIEYPDGSTNRVEYDDDGNVTKLHARDGSTITREGDHWIIAKDGKISRWDGEIYVTEDGDIASRLPDGRTKVRGVDGSETIIEPGKGQMTTNLKGEVTSVTYPDGTTNKIEYDENGNVTRIEARDGSTIEREGERWKITKDGETTFLDGDINVTKEGDIYSVADDGSIQIRHRDGSETVTHPDQSQVCTNSERKVTSITRAPDLKTTTIEYGRDGEPRLIKNPDGTNWLKQGPNWNRYDRKGNRVEQHKGDIEVAESGDISMKKSDGSAVVHHLDGTKTEVPGSQKTAELERDRKPPEQGESKQKPDKPETPADRGGAGGDNKSGDRPSTVPEAGFEAGRVKEEGILSQPQILPVEGDPSLEVKVLPMEEGIESQPQIQPVEGESESAGERGLASAEKAAKSWEEEAKALEELAQAEEAEANKAGEDAERLSKEAEESKGTAQDKRTAAEDLRKEAAGLEGEEAAERERQADELEKEAEQAETEAREKRESADYLQHRAEELDADVKTLRTNAEEYRNQGEAQRNKIEELRAQAAKGEHTAIDTSISQEVDKSSVDRMLTGINPTLEPKVLPMDEGILTEPPILPVEGDPSLEPKVLPTEEWVSSSPAAEAEEAGTLAGNHAVVTTKIESGKVYYENPAGGTDHSYPKGEGVPIKEFTDSISTVGKGAFVNGQEGKPGSTKSDAEGSMGAPVEAKEGSKGSPGSEVQEKAPGREELQAQPEAAEDGDVLVGGKPKAADIDPAEVAVQIRNAVEDSHDPAKDIREGLKGMTPEQIGKINEALREQWGMDLYDVVPDLALESRVAEAIKDPKEQQEFLENMKKFEGNMAKMQEQYQKELEAKGMDPSEAAKEAERKAAEQIEKTYRNLDRLLEKNDSAPVNEKDRIILAEQCIRHAADPTTICQGNHGTCNATTVETRTFTKDPAEATRLVADVATTGHYTSNGTPPVTVDLTKDKYSLQKQGQSREVPPEKRIDGHRDYASQLFQVTAINVFLEKQNRAETPPGQLRYEQRRAEPGDRRRPDDNGDCVVDYSKEPPAIISDGVPAFDTPGIAGMCREISPGNSDGIVAITSPTNTSGAENMLKPVIELYKLKEGADVDLNDPDSLRKLREWVKSNESIPENSRGTLELCIDVIEQGAREKNDSTVLTVKSEAEMKEALAKLKREGKLPVVIAVDTNNEPFRTDSGGGAAGGSGGDHVVTITDFDENTGVAKIQNQWSKEDNHDISVHDLYQATLEPAENAANLNRLAELEKQVEDNHQKGKIDYQKEYEVLHLKHRLGKLTGEEFNSKYAEVLEKEVEENRLHNKIDYMKEYELLKLKHDLKKISDNEWNGQYYQLLDKEVAENRLHNKIDFMKEDELLKHKHETGEVSQAEFDKKHVELLEKQVAEDRRKHKTDPENNPIDYGMEAELLELKHKAGKISDKELVDTLVETYRQARKAAQEGMIHRDQFNTDVQGRLSEIRDKLPPDQSQQLEERIKAIIQEQDVSAQQKPEELQEQPQLADPPVLTDGQPPGSELPLADTAAALSSPEISSDMLPAYLGSPDVLLGRRVVDVVKEQIEAFKAVEEQHKRLTELAEAKIDVPEHLEQFKNDMEKFEARRDELQQLYKKQYEEEGFAPEEAGLKAQKKAAEEIAETYRNIARILEAEGDEPLYETERRFAAMQILHHATDPTTIDQGDHPTCNVSTVEARLYTRSPSEVARVVADMATTGLFITRSDPWTVIALNENSRRPDAEGMFHPPSSSARSYASQLFQLTAINIAWERWNRQQDPPTKMRYEQLENHTRLVDYSKNPPDGEVELRQDGTPTQRTGIGNRDLVEVTNEITGGDESEFVIQRGGGSDKIKGVRSPEELSSKLAEMKEKGELPAIMYVHTRNEPFYSDGGAPGWHVVTVTDFDAESGKVSLDNQWGEGVDHIGENAISVEQLFESMSKAPIADLEDYRGAIEELETLKKDGKLTEEEYERKLLDTIIENEKSWKEQLANGSASPELVEMRVRLHARINEIISKMPPEQRTKMTMIVEALQKTETA